MRYELDALKLTDRETKAVFSALFSMALADGLLHSKEVACIFESVANHSILSEGHKKRISKLAKDPLPNDESYEIIAQGTDQFKLSVFNILVDIALSDNHLHEDELRALKMAFLKIGIKHLPPDMKKEVAPSLAKVVQHTNKFPLGQGAFYTELQNFFSRELSFWGFRLPAPNGTNFEPEEELQKIKDHASHNWINLIKDRQVTPKSSSETPKGETGGSDLVEEILELIGKQKKLTR